MMFSSCPHKDKAWEVIKFFSSEESLKGYLEAGLYLPISDYMDGIIDKSKTGRLADFALTDRDELQLNIGHTEAITTRGRLRVIGGVPQPPTVLNPGWPIHDFFQSSSHFQAQWRRAYAPGSEFQVRYAYTQDGGSDEYTNSSGATPYRYDTFGDVGRRHEIERGRRDGDVALPVGKADVGRRAEPAQQFATMAADGLVLFDILGRDRRRFLPGGGPALAGRQRRQTGLHAAQRPVQVDGRRPGIP